MGAILCTDKAPMHKKPADACPKSEGSTENALMPHYTQSTYEHSEALADPLPYFSTLHAIVKIVTGVVDKEIG